MEPLEIALITSAGFILFLSLLGNLALCVVVYCQLSYQAVRNYSYLILNLAISDVLFAVSCIPFDIVQRIESPFFPFGQTMCKLLWPFQTVCGMASIFSVGALSYQRYRLVVRPFNGKLSRRRFFLMLATIWILPVVLAGMPYSFVLQLDQNTSQCYEEWIPRSKRNEIKLGFTIYLFIIQYVLPLGLIVWCNVQAIYRLKRYLKYRKRSSVICAFSIDNHENTVKMLSAIMAVFASFWLPGQVMHFLIEFEPENDFILNYGQDIGYLFVFTNCVMNPLIFAYFTRCHKKFPIFRRLTSSSSMNPTSACELGYSKFRRDSQTERSGDAPRRGSLPGTFKRLPLSSSRKRPSLPAILHCEAISVKQRKELLSGRQQRWNSSKEHNDILFSKKKLPTLSEIPKSEAVNVIRKGDLSAKIQSSDAKTKASEEKQNSLSDMSKCLSFFTPSQDCVSDERESNFFSIAWNKNVQARREKQNSFRETDKLMRTEKRASISILKKQDPLGPTQTEKKGEMDSGNKLMKNFMEILRTMKGDVLRKYLDASPETVLN